MSRVPYVRVLQILTPFIPGFVLVVGWLLIRPHSASKLFSIQVIGYYTKLAVVVLSTYIAGWVLIFIVASLMNFIWLKLWQRLQSPVNKFSEDSEWRKAAAQFIGANLGPIDESKWREWYLVLQNYFIESSSVADEWHQLSTTVQATGFAGLILLCVGPLKHWFLWIVCFLAIFGGALWPWWLTPIPSGARLTAKILRELKTDSSQSGNR